LLLILQTISGANFNNFDFFRQGHGEILVSYWFIEFTLFLTLGDEKITARPPHLTDLERFILRHRLITKTSGISGQSLNNTF
jgi:hypothetical protein